MNFQNKLKKNLRNYFFSFIFLLVLITNNIFYNNVAYCMDNFQNNYVIEQLRLKIPTKYKEAWLRSEKKIWEPWLSKQDGFLGRKLFWDKKNEEALILVSWQNRELWKSIEMKEVFKVQEKFESDVKKSLNINENPFELIFEGELISQE